MMRHARDSGVPKRYRHIEKAHAVVSSSTQPFVKRNGRCGAPLRFCPDEAGTRIPCCSKTLRRVSTLM